MSGIEIFNYAAILNELKDKIKQARIRAALSVNKELLQTYWEIGDIILKRQNQEGWGTKVIDRLAKDLKSEFFDFQGLSIRNLKYMRAFAEAYPYFPYVQGALAQMPELNSIGSQKSILQAPLAQLSTSAFLIDNQSSIIVQAPLAKLTWYHHITLLDKVKDPAIRQFYILKTIENGWSRNVMVHQIESGLHNRQGALVTNFNKTVAPEQSELLQQIFKDPYNFDFLQMTDRVRERDLETALIQHIKKFLLELGDGFAFMGQQYRLSAGEKEYIVDLLFYHTKLRRHIIVDLLCGVQHKRSYVA